MEFLALLASLILIWMAWQLYRAKQFTRFKREIEGQLKPQVIEALNNHLEQTRSDLFPNNECHQQAAQFYWCQYKSRIVQAALKFEVIDKQWLIDNNKFRHCQHLFHIEQAYLADLESFESIRDQSQ
ncbi:hypothetical protein [Thalassotalea fusca]